MIFVEDKSIKVGGAVLSGVLRSIEITRNAAIDNVDVEGAAVKPKQAVGYEESTVRIELLVGLTEGETAENKAEKINLLFRGKGQNIPQPMNIVCTETMLAGINQVLFSKLTYKKDYKDDLYAFSLQFCEYSAPYIQVKSAGAAGSASQSTASTSASTPAYESNVSAAYQKYLDSLRGFAPKFDNKTAQSPITDNRAPRGGMARE